MIFLFIGALVFWSCDDSTRSDDNPVPGRVSLVAKSAEGDSVEAGIDAVYVPATLANGIFLQWHQVDDNDLAAYRIYRSTVDTSTALTLIGAVVKSVGKIDTSYIDSNVEVGRRYYYRVSAIDEAGQEGPRSKAAHYKLWEMCSLDAPPPFDSTFQWTWPVNQPHSFVFRLRSVIGSGIYVNVKIGTFMNTYNPNQQWSLGDLGLNPLEPGLYEWRIDIIGSEPNHGSESEWRSFPVN